MNPSEAAIAAARGNGPSTAKQKAEAKCPFGCTGDRLNDHGYCKHLVGFANGDSRMMEARVFDQKEAHYVERVGGPESVRHIPKGAEFVQIGTCTRIYTREGIENYDEYVGLVKKPVLPPT